MGSPKPLTVEETHPSGLWALSFTGDTFQIITPFQKKGQDGLSRVSLKFKYLSYFSRSFLDVFRQRGSFQEFCPHFHMSGDISIG